MTHTELRHRIQDIIREVTGCEFVRKIHIVDCEPCGYSVGLEMRQYDPVWITAELPDKEFLDFIEKELKRAGYLHKVDYTKSVRNTTLDHPLNKLESPYDTARING